MEWKWFVKEDCSTWYQIYKPWSVQVGRRKPVWIHNKNHRYYASTNSYWDIDLQRMLVAACLVSMPSEPLILNPLTSELLVLNPLASEFLLNPLTSEPLVLNLLTSEFSVLSPLTSDLLVLIFRPHTPGIPFKTYNTESGMLLVLILHTCSSSTNLHQQTYTCDIYLKSLQKQTNFTPLWTVGWICQV